MPGAAYLGGCGRDECSGQQVRGDDLGRGDAAMLQTDREDIMEIHA